MELTVGDLLKNLIFKNIQPGHDKDVAKDLWKEITKNIEETNTELKRFIRYFWLSRYGFVQEKKLYKEIKNKIGQSDWPAFLQELKESSQIYNSILVGDKSDFADYESHCFKIFSSISAIRLMGVSQCYVLFLSILSNYNRLGFDPYRYFQLIEKFTFQYSVVCKLPGNRVEKIYSKYAVEIDSAARNLAGDKKTRKLNSIFSRLEAEIKNEAPSEILFLDSFSDISYKKSKEVIHLITYMLNEIDAFYKKGDEYQINPKTINIEHLLPQNPDKEWGLNKQDIKGYVNKLGNLTLLSKEINGRMENAVISKKLPLLKESEIAMTKNLVTLLEELDCHWDENQIALRHQTFAEIAYKEIWKL